MNACTFPGTSVECAAAKCENGVESAAANCDGAGTCPTPSTQSCGNFACGGATCKTTCATQSDCKDGLICVGQQCVVPEAGPEAGPDAADAEPDQKADAPKADTGTDAKVDVSDEADAVADATSEQGDAASAVVEESKDEGGCGCATPGDRTPRHAIVLALLAMAAVAARRRVRPHA